MNEHAIEYKKYVIEPSHASVKSLAWTFRHEDYDGPEDRRTGLARSPEECMDLIDDQIFEMGGICGEPSE